MTTDFGTSGADALGVAVQPDGKIVAVGYASSSAGSSDFAVARYNADGSLDTAFGDAGTVTTSFGGAAAAKGVVVQPDGKIVVAGAGSYADGSIAIARYNTDGSLDASFGGGAGKVTAVFSTGAGSAYGVALQADGKIVIAGPDNYFGGGYAHDFGVARFNTDGSLDASFGVSGEATTSFGNFDNTATCVAIQGGGKIVVAGYTGVEGAFDFAVARYNPDGSLDAGFNGSGMQTTDFGGRDVASSVALQPEGKIVVAGDTNVNGSAFALARYNANGSLDASFGGAGAVTTHVSSAISDSEGAFGVAVQADGKIVAVGTAYDAAANSNDFALVRYGNSHATSADLTATIDWGDGSPTATGVISYSAGVYTVNGSHTYAEEGSYPISISVVDVGGSTTTISGTATVVDAALTGSSAATAGGTEGAIHSSILSGATFTDANPGDNSGDMTATITWGDGGPTSAGTVSYSNGVYTVSGSHTYAEEGDYPISISVVDVGGSTTTISGTATVADAPLTGSSAATAGGTEGAIHSSILSGATFTDANPGDHSGDMTATIDWGDSGPTSLGLISYSNGVYTVAGSHTYAEEGNYPISISVVDVGGSATTISGTATVADAALTGSSAATAGGAEGATNSSVLSGATFTDANPGDNSGDMTATIAWGDSGLTSPGAVSYSNGVYTVAGSHTYLEEGNYPISISVVDVGGSTTTISGTATVADAPLTAAATPVTTAVFGTPFSGQVATFADANPAAPLGDFPLANVTIAWGDGSTSNATAITQPGGAGTAFDVFGSHTYGKAGATASPIQVTITDVGGAASNNTSYTPTVSPYAFSYTIQSDSQTYSSPAKLAADLPATISTGIDGENLSIVYASVGDTAGAQVGSYAIAGSLSDGTGFASNYSVTLTNGTLTVNPAPLTITADNQAKVYGAPLPALTASYSGFVNGECSTCLTTLPTLTTTATCSSHVCDGPCTITAAGAVDPNYTISYVAGALTVTPAPLTITADNQTKVYGDPLPTLTAGYTGFVNGDCSDCLAPQPTLTTTATAASHVSGGPYPITASGAAEPDYNIGYAAGTLTVTKYAFTCTIGNVAQIYGSPANLAADLPATIATGVNGQNLAITYSSAGDTATAPVGAYAITGVAANGTGLASDYAVTFNPGTLTVIAATSTTIVSRRRLSTAAPAQSQWLSPQHMPFPQTTSR